MKLGPLANTNPIRSDHFTNRSHAIKSRRLTNRIENDDPPRRDARRPVSRLPGLSLEARRGDRERRARGAREARASRSRRAERTGVRRGEWRESARGGGERRLPFPREAQRETESGETSPWRALSLSLSLESRAPFLSRVISVMIYVRPQASAPAAPRVSGARRVRVRASAAGAAHRAGARARGAASPASPPSRSGCHAAAASSRAPRPPRWAPWAAHRPRHCPAAPLARGAPHRHSPP